MRTGFATNEYGTVVSVHVCDTCGRGFTLCPADRDGLFGGDCLAYGCASYDESRDIDRVWDGVQSFVRAD